MFNKISVLDKGAHASVEDLGTSASTRLAPPFPAFVRQVGPKLLKQGHFAGKGIEAQFVQGG